MNYPPVPLNDTAFRLYVQVLTTSGVAVADDTAPTYGIYKENSNTPLLTGSFNGTVVNSKTGFYNTAALGAPAASGFESGARYVARIETHVSSAVLPYTQTFAVT